MIISSGKAPASQILRMRVFLLPLGGRVTPCAARVKSLPGKTLLRGGQGRAEIAQFVVDLVSFSNGLGDFFAEQIAITVTQPV